MLPSTPEYCLFWIDWWPLCMTKAEWSGWLQAIGAVAAILIAVWVGNRQARLAYENDLRLAALAEHQKRRAILAIAAGAARRAAAIGELFASKEINLALFFNNYSPSILNSQIQALSAVPAHEVGSPQAAAAMLDLRDQLGFLRDSINRWESRRNDSSVVEPGTRDQFDAVSSRNIKTHVDAVRRHYDEMERSLMATRDDTER